MNWEEIKQSLMREAEGVVKAASDNINIKEKIFDLYLCGVKHTIENIDVLVKEGVLKVNGQNYSHQNYVK